jgi:integrase
VSIFKRSKDGPYWFAFMFRGQRIQKSTKQFDKDAAKDIESAYRTQLAKGEVGIHEKKVGRWKISDLLDRRLADLRERGKGDDSLIGQVKKDFGARWADELTDDDLNAYFKERRAEGYAVATITNRIAELMSAYNLAGLEHPKMRELSDEEKDNVRTGFFSKVEFEAICERMPEELRDFCRFGYLTGWRFGSIAKLRWDAIEDGEINLPGRFTKNKKPLKMPLFGELAELIARREEKKIVKTATGAQLSSLVFHATLKKKGAGQPIQQSWFRLVWIEACLAAGQGRMFCRKCGQECAELKRECSHCRGDMKYEGRLFHDLRRSAARDMIRAGVAQTIAMKITGHKTATMFQRYNISDTDDLRDALSRTALYREAGQQKVRSIAAGKR